MEELPPEMCLKIFSRLSPQDLASVQSVCRNWNTIGSEDSLWRDLFKKRWGSKEAAPSDSRSWKDAYKLRYQKGGKKFIMAMVGDEYYIIRNGNARYLGKRFEMPATVPR